MRLGVKYPWRRRRRVIVPVWVQVVIECEELLMCPIHVGGVDPLLCGYGSGVNDDQHNRDAAAMPKVVRTGFRRHPRHV